VLEAIGAGRDRILLTLATGTGKTFIAFQLAWKLFHSRWNLNDWRAGTEPSRRPRVLFLADGLILESGTPDEVLKAPREDRTRGFIARHNEFRL
jgi:type I site-specific restriction endonuclease